MMRLCIFSVVVALSALAATAQNPQSTPPPPPQSTPQPVVRAVRVPDSRANVPFPLNPVAESDRLASRVVMLQQFIAPLYRRPTSKELAAVAPDTRAQNRYSAFLSSPGTGIFRLVPDAGCAPNDLVINAKEECLKYSMPGAGNSFSFRAESHRIRHLADVTLVGDKLKITGIFMHGMMAEIGDVPIEAITLGSPGMRFLSAFAPSTNADSVVAVDNKLTTGVVQDGFRYAKELTAAEDSTYVLRSVAYRGKLVRSARGIPYNELDYDKREDIIVAFRVVERAEDGSVTIVWKQLTDLESPKIKLPKPNRADEGN
jgi:hypothetical protein